MKKFLALFLAVSISVFAFGQWVSPGNGSYYNLSSLCLTAYPAVSSPQSGTFQIHQNITISANDILCLESSNQEIMVDDNVTITIIGSLITATRTNQLLFSGDSTGTSFFELLLDQASTTNLSHVHFQYGDQILLFNPSHVVFDSCEFNGFSNSAINYMNCNPTIQNCYFHDNQKAAITSAVNTAGSPKILSNYFYNNDLSNANVPQINIGPGAEDTIIIADNHIQGVAQSMSGGIGIMNMGASNTVLRVKGNVIENNRYGYTQNGTNIYAIIEDNIIRNNNLETNPNNGGSGISIYGSTTSCAAKIRRNLIHGNLWGITAIYNHNIDMGTAEDPGGNVLYNNGNNNVDYELYNNSSCHMSAIGNYWGNNDSSHAEDVIYHQADNSSYGLVTYNPIMELYPDILDFRILLSNNPQITNVNEDLVFFFSDSDTLYYSSAWLISDLSAVVPTITIPLGVSCTPSPEDIVNLWNAVTYTLTTPHGTSKDWVVVLYLGDGITELSEIPVSVVQNPVSNGILSIRNESGKNMQVEVYSTTGQKLYQIQCADEMLNIPTNCWNDGMYLVRVSQEKKSKMFKVLVF